MLGWSTRRKFLYTGSAGILFFVVSLWTYLTFFNAAPLCTDGTQNGGETGVDCGGPCATVCSVDARAPRVLWARAFPVASSTYTAAAYVQNANVGAGARQVHYTFQLYDKTNALVAERDGVTDLPPVSTVPIIETGISVGYRPAVRALLNVTDVPTWSRVGADKLPALSLSHELLSSDGTKLSAIVENNSFVDANSLTVVAVLFDQRDVALAASRSTISVNAKSTASVVFTWPQPVVGVTHAEITMLPSF